MLLLGEEHEGHQRVLGQEQGDGQRTVEGTGVGKWPPREHYHAAGLRRVGMSPRRSKLVLLTLCCVLGSPVERV